MRQGYPHVYDSIAPWYEKTFGGYAVGPSAKVLTRTLGDGAGWCLDVGCGTGLHFEAIAATGRRPVGVDLSFEQLRIAAGRLPEIVEADGTRLPFADAVFPTVVSTFTHTDVPDFGLVMHEISRVLLPGGTFVYVGVHPCFVHFAAERRDDGILVHPGYGSHGHIDASPFFRPGGLRARVGEHHIGLDGLLMSIIDADLDLRIVEEIPGGYGIGATSAEQVPGLLAIAALKSLYPASGGDAKRSFNQEEGS